MGIFEIIMIILSISLIVNAFMFMINKDLHIKNETLEERLEMVSKSIKISGNTTDIYETIKREEISVRTKIKEAKTDEEIDNVIDSVRKLYNEL